jgi:hypothetical protein
VGHCEGARTQKGLMYTRDRRLVEIDQYWSTTSRVIRALQRLDEPGTAIEVALAMGVGPEDVKSRNTIQAMLLRLAARGIAIKTPPVAWSKIGYRGFYYGATYSIAPRYRRAKHIKITKAERPLRVA